MDTVNANASFDLSHQLRNYGAKDPNFAWNPGARWVLGVSGGLDSVVLLDLLARFQPEFQWHLLIAHCHHGLRGEAADKDAAFVQRLAESKNLPFKLGNEPFAQNQTSNGRESIEMAARRMRHVFLARTARDWNADAIVLAHHADDQLELVFLRLFRGAGGLGLGGMQRKSPSPADLTLPILRPLLDFRRVDLLAHAQTHHLEYREDASNLDLSIPRNRWRHAVLPDLRRQFGSGWESAVLRSVDLVRTEAACIRQLALDWVNGQEQRPDWDTLHTALQRAVLREQWLKLGQTDEFAPVEWLRQNPGQPWTTAPNERYVQKHGIVSLLPVTDPHSQDFNTQSWSVNELTNTGSVRCDDRVLFWTRTRCDPNAVEEARRITRSGTEILIDAQTVSVPLTIRYWQPGDRYQPLGLEQPVKLQDWFTNKKVPTHERRQRLIVVDPDGTLIWVEGQPPAHSSRIRPSTKELLHLQIQGESGI
jgi:tRNA(Ile)-lysidine synthase